VTRPFRGKYGLDSNSERVINVAAPIEDTDAANKLFTEEQIAAQSRLQGTYEPDSDGLENPDIDLDALAPGVDVLTADYWITARSGRANSGPFERVNLNSDDRLVANVSDGGVTAVTVNPAAATGLIPNEPYRIEVEGVTTSEGNALALIMETDATGTVVTTRIANAGYSYEVGDVIFTVLPNTFVGAIAPIPTLVPGAFALLPNTTYYDAVLSGGTGAGATANFRTGATGTEITDIFIISRGSNYTVNDVITVEIEGQTVGTMTVTAVFNGTDVPITVTVDAINTLTGWDLIRGPGLTRAQADQDYLRRDGSNSPTRDISWNNLHLTDLADPLQQQDAVNLRTLLDSTRRLQVAVTQPAHGFTTGQAVTYDFNTDTFILAQADAEVTLADGIVEVLGADNFILVRIGTADWPTHGLTPGQSYYLDTATAGALTATRPQVGYVQALIKVRNADAVDVDSQAALFTGFSA
jgi:hypothetical protein